MKKTLFFIAFIISTMLLQSCTDENNVTLTGKKFVYAPRTAKDNNGNYLYWVMTFTSSRIVKQDCRIGSSSGDYFTSPESCTYKLTYPKLEITEEDGSVYTYTFISKLSYKLDTNNTVYNQE